MPERTSSPLPEAPSPFIRELAAVLNKHSVENISDTPDFILASYLNVCLLAFSRGVGARDRWLGRDPFPIANGERRDKADTDAEEVLDHLAGTKPDPDAPSAMSGFRTLPLGPVDYDPVAAVPDVHRSIWVVRSVLMQLLNLMSMQYNDNMRLSSGEIPAVIDRLRRELNEGA